MIVITRFPHGDIHSGRWPSLVLHPGSQLWKVFTRNTIRGKFCNILYYRLFTWLCASIVLYRYNIQIYRKETCLSVINTVLYSFEKAIKYIWFILIPTLRIGHVQCMHVALLDKLSFLSQRLAIPSEMNSSWPFSKKKI